MAFEVKAVGREGHLPVARDAVDDADEVRVAVRTVVRRLESQARDVDRLIDDDPDPRVVAVSLVPLVPRLRACKKQVPWEFIPGAAAFDRVLRRDNGDMGEVPAMKFFQENRFSLSVDWRPRLGFIFTIENDLAELEFV